MQTAIIVEDNAAHATLLISLIQETNIRLNILAICTDIESAIDAVKKNKPAYIFLDIELNGNKRGGFEILVSPELMNCKVIFTTAYINENILEIRRCSLPYLIKPYVFNEVNKLLDNIEFNRIKTDQQQLRFLRSNLLKKDVQEKIMFLKIQNEILPIEIRHIIYFTSQDPIVKIVFQTNDQEIITRAKANDVFCVHGFHNKHHQSLMYVIVETRITLKEFDQDLCDLNFCQVHKSYLINLFQVKKFVLNNSTSSKVQMVTGEMINVSTAGRNLLYRTIGR